MTRAAIFDCDRLICLVIDFVKPGFFDLWVAKDSVIVGFSGRLQRDPKLYLSRKIFGTSKFLSSDNSSVLENQYKT